mmetsp:Transcript_50197/g.73722  ORF Transcript_50197/g.73722 Transcript_50197/m.73722 type:complete len:100 (+) Transcript_50197:1627-1926(+)
MNLLINIILGNIMLGNIISVNIILEMCEACGKRHTYGAAEAASEPQPLLCHASIFPFCRFQLQLEHCLGNFELVVSLSSLREWLYPTFKCRLELVHLLV